MPGPIDVGETIINGMIAAGQMNDARNSYEFIVAAEQAVGYMTAIALNPTTAGFAIAANAAAAAGTLGNILADYRNTGSINFGDVAAIAGNIAVIATAAVIANHPLSRAAQIARAISRGIGIIGAASYFVDRAVAAETNSHYTNSQRSASPIMLDLDGDGLEITQFSGGSITFDHNADGVRTGTAWVGRDDGLLVWDRDGNGAIDSGRELFGNNTLLANGQTAADGWAALRDLDLNGDGVLDLADAAFAELRVWRDLDQDGTSDEGELFTLEALGITQIGLNKTNSTQTLADGTRLDGTGHFTINGQTQQYTDAWFAENPFYRQFATSIEVSEEVRALPGMQGSGAVRDLREAAMLSQELRTLLAQFQASTSRDEQRALIDPILKAWADTSDFVTVTEWQAMGRPVSYTFNNLTGVEAEAWRHRLAVLEAFNAQNYEQLNSSGTTTVWTGQDRFDLLQQSYTNLSESVYRALALQTRLKSYLDSISLVIDENGIRFDISVLNALLDTAYATNERNAILDLAELFSFTKDTLDSIGFDAVGKLAGWAYSQPSGSQIHSELHQLGISLIVGTAQDDILHGGHGNDILIGGTGNDSLRGGEGDDVYIGSAGNDHLEDSSTTSSDIYRFGVGDGQDLIVDRGGSADRIELGEGILQTDVLLRSNGEGLSLTLSSGDRIAVMDVFAVGSGAVNATRAIEHIVFADGTIWNVDRMLAEMLRGTSADDFIYGSSTDDYIEGGFGNDTLSGMDGNDVLIGGEGDDYLWGGAGADTYIFDVGFGRDTVASFGQGADRIVFEEGISPSDLSLSAEGGSLRIRHADGSTIQALGFFQSTPHQDTRIEFSDGTMWTVDDLRQMLDVPLSPISVSPSNIYFLTDGNNSFGGSSFANNAIYGLAGNDTLRGYSGNDFLHGGLGNDNLWGGAGNDILWGDAGNDMLQGEAGSDHLEGGDGDDYLWGGGGGAGFHDVLDGGAGNDTLNGSGASTTYVFGHGYGRDRIEEYASGQQVGEVNIVRMREGVTADSLVGLQRANDTVFWLSSTDHLLINQGNLSAISKIVFADGTEWNQQTILERTNNTAVTRVGTGDLSWSGQEGHPFEMDLPEGLFQAGNLSGNLTYSLLSSGSWYYAPTGLSIDPQSGRVFGDVYYTGYEQSFSIVVTDNLGFSASVHVRLNVGQAPSIIHGTSGNDVLVGTSDVDTVYGYEGDDTLDGGAEADNLVGGVGNDTYIVDNVGDTIIELENEGIDLVRSSRSWTLGEHLENLTLMGSSALTGTGNALDNVLTGNSGNNTLYGLEGNDWLDGGTGSDTMYGGTGDDTYVVERTGDVVVEYADEGVDTVRSSVSYTLGAHVENLVLTGTSGLSGTGNELNNVLTGNSGNNTLTGGAGDDYLDGGAGSDTMRGGTGNDTYVVERTGDIVTENANEGIDTVRSSITYTLGANVENFTLTGSANLNGTGNALDNMLIGNAGNNTLAGGAGNDTYEGGAGNDVLNDTSTTSNDVYRWGRGHGADTVTDAGGTDRLDVLEGVDAEQIWLRRSGNHLEVSVIGTSDSFTISNWYTNSANRIESFQLSNGQALASTQVQALVDAMASFAPPAAGQTTLPPNYQSSLGGVIASSWS